ncbi:MAG: hypothetical protein J6A01_08375 [Proteobacteria bacterium]|nr:hypothetical protein [Pseudomonadota bacterium]
MKKIALMISLFGLAASLNACGGDSHSARCDANFKNTCERGMILHCDMQSTDKYGEIVESATIDINGIRYVCNDKDELVIDDNSVCDASFESGCKNGVHLKCEFSGDAQYGHIIQEERVVIDSVSYVCNEQDELVIADYACKDGKLTLAGTAVEKNAACTATDLVISCAGDKVILGAQACKDSSVLKCHEKDLLEEPCDQGFTCMDYEREDKLYASCVKSDAIVGEGCAENVTAKGTCQPDGSLIFCTRKDASKGKTLRLDCAAENKACMLINDEYGFDCSLTCKDDQGASKNASGTPYTEHGFCDGNVLYYCSPKDNAVILKQSNCSQDGKTCGFVESEHQYNCHP